MTKVTRKPLKTVSVKMSEEQLKTLDILMRNTGLGKSGVLKLALTELATRRLPRLFGPESGDWAIPNRILKESSRADPTSG